MKKFVLFGLTFLMLLSLSVTAFAAPGAFVESPSGKEGPVLVGFEPLSPDCEGQVVLTPFGDRDSLDSQSQSNLQAAYDQISGASDLIDLCGSLGTVAEEMGLAISSLAVSDLFNLHYTDCDVHDSHEGFDITISAEALDNFAGLMYYTDEGWKLFEDVILSENDKTITFTVDSLPKQVAIVVGTTVPSTGDSADYWVYIVVMVLSAATVLAMVIYSRKRTA